MSTDETGIVDDWTAGVIAGRWSTPAGLFSGEDGPGAVLPGLGAVLAGAVLPGVVSVGLGTEVGLPADWLGSLGRDTGDWPGVAVAALVPDGATVVGAGSSTRGAASTAFRPAAPARTTAVAATVSPPARPTHPRHRGARMPGGARPG